MLELIRKWSVCTSLLLVASVAAAEDVPPDLLLKGLTADVAGVVKRSRGQLVIGRASDVNEVVESKVAPVFDFPRMTRTALGQHWGLATAPQRAALTAEFKTLLVRTYATVLERFRDHVIEFKPLTLDPRATQATVRSVIRHGASAATPVDYEVEKTAAGWKVYEIRFDGVNLIENYRPTFATRVQHLGIDGLINILAEKNRQSS